MYLKSIDFQTIYLSLLKEMVNKSILVAKTKMILDLHFELVDPRLCFINLKKNWIWALHEGINRFSFNKPELMNPGTAHLFRPNWNKKLQKEGGTFCYSYGEVFKRELPIILKKLRSKSEREAIISIWDSKYLDNKKYPRRPCTLTLHFFIVSNALHCSCNMRTVDVMNLLPYDIFHHTLLQRIIASELNLDLGSFYFNASFAYYQKKRDETNSVINTIDKLSKSEILPFNPDWRLTLNDIQCLSDVTEFSAGMIPSIDVRSLKPYSYPWTYFKALTYNSIVDNQKTKIIISDSNLYEFQIINY